MTLKETIVKLLKEGKTEKMVTEMLNFLQGKDEDLYNEVAMLQGNMKEGKKKLSLSLISDSDFNQIQARVRSRILDMLNEVDSGTELTGTATTSNTTTSPNQVNNTGAGKVFISYNHNDKEIANKLKDLLRTKNIEVVIDSEAMLAGSDIKEFIENCIRTTDVTLSLVSKKSLMSAWVAMESIGTFYHEKTSNKKFIACFIDDDFFRRDFTDLVLDDIDVQITEIRDLITKRMEKGRNIRDLQNELTRFTDLQHNIDEIIRRIKESLSIDIRGEKLEASFPRLVDAIKQ